MLPQHSQVPSFTVWWPLRITVWIPLMSLVVIVLCCAYVCLFTATLQEALHHCTPLLQQHCASISITNRQPPTGSPGHGCARTRGGGMAHRHPCVRH